MLSQQCRQSPVFAGEPAVTVVATDPKRLWLWKWSSVIALAPGNPGRVPLEASALPESSGLPLSATSVLPSATSREMSLKQAVDTAAGTGAGREW